MKRFRIILFWTHLTAGLVAGISIGIMCFTGAALSFENEITAWSERDARRVMPPATDALRLTLDDLIKRVREFQPEARPSGISVSSDPRDAAVFSLGRDSALYANPYTGEVRRPASTKIRDLMHTLEDWHRVLAMGGDNRVTGKMINGACNLAFFVLAVSGLYLWWPRSWSWRGIKAVAFFNWKHTGKARDFNWHNVIGLWSAPILIVLTLTAVPMSYRWGATLIYKIAGEQPPAQQAAGPAGLAGPTVEIPKPAPGTRPLDYEAILTSVQKEIPRWETLSIRFGAPAARGARTTTQISAANNANGVLPSRDASLTKNQAQRERPASESRSGAQAIAVTVKEPRSWPRTATTTLTLNPYTAEVLIRESYADLAKSRQIRSWTRFLHTGQALGWPGQLAAALACVGGCVLVYTGVSLACRRFFGWKKKTAANSVNGT